MNEKPLSPAEFYALCKHFGETISPYDIDRAYSMLNPYLLKPASPTEALMMVQQTLINAGISAIL